MFYSVLFPKDKGYPDVKDENVKDKPYLKDIGLDLLFDSINKPMQKFGIEKHYYESLQDIDIISYRQEIMRELEENEELRKIVTDFSNEVYSIRQSMNVVRKGLSSGERSSNNYLTRGHMLDYAEKYCQAITKLKENILKVKIHSDGLLEFVRYINKYVATEKYKNFTLAVQDLREEFSNIHYNMLINEGNIKVRKYQGQEDYSKKILETFEKFRQDGAKDYRHELTEEPIAGHVESGVLDLLSKLYKDKFSQLSTFCSKFIDFDDDIIIRFSNEIQFYISWLDFIYPLKKSGLSFNYPKMESTSEHLFGYECFDVALAAKTQEQLVTNDFTIDSPESIIVVTGPNQGGKTTFAKMFGQMHYLASLGLCVPGREASLYTFDTIYTHFGKEEELATENGKLKDDLERLYEITTEATNKSLIIINEIFSSTTLEDAIYLGGRMMNQLIELKAPTIIVTFLDELALHGEAVVSMMSTVKDDESMERTYKIIRKPPDGSAYAIHIASKHGLTYKKLYRRLNQ